MTDTAKVELTKKFEKLVLDALITGGEYLDIDDCYEQGFDNAYKKHQQMVESLQKHEAQFRKERFRKDIIDMFELLNASNLDIPAFTRAEVEEFLDDQVVDTIYTAVTTLREKIEQKLGTSEANPYIDCDTCASSDCDNNDDITIQNFLKQFR